MPPAPATGDTTTRTVKDQFLDLICGDADLLAAEFDAIIAAQWPEPPGHSPGRGAAGRHPGSSRARRAGDRVPGAVLQPRHPGVGGCARQRSPPFRHSTPTLHA